MALFKIFKGTSLTSDNKSGLEGLNKKVSTATEGFCYFTTDDGKMYIDISNNLNDRVCLNANMADQLRTARKIKLTGDATGEASFNGTADAEIDVEISGLDDLSEAINTNKDNLTTLTTTISTMNTDLMAAIDKKLDKTDNATTATRATTAGIADKVANQLIIGNQVFDGATEITVTARDLGLTGAMVYKGISTTAITDGGTQAPTIGGSSVATNTLQAGNVVLYGNQEFVWNGSKWELLGDEGSYKVKQTAVTNPTADGYEVSFIDSISQDANGKITATKKTVVSASETANGLITKEMVTKLNGIATGANKYSLPIAGSVLGGIKAGGDINITSAGIVTVPQVSTNELGTDKSTHDLNTLYLAGKFKFWNLSSNGTYNNAPGGTVTGTRIGLYCYPISSSAFVQEAMINGKKYFRVSTNGSTSEPVAWADWQLCLSGNTLTNNLFIQGTNPYLGFKNSSGVAKGYVQYIQSTDTYAFGAGADNSLKVSATGSISIPANQTFTPATNNTGTIGTTEKKWNNIYATTFTGNLSGTATKATKLETTRTINGISFNGSANVTNYGVCGTAAEVVAKTVTVGSTFVLAEGAQVVVKFTNANTATAPKLNVNGTGEKPIVQYGTTAVGSGTTTTAWIAGSVQTFTFDGTSWVRDYWSNTTYTVLPITQTVSTDNIEYPLLSRTTNLVTTGNGHAKFAAGVTLNPSTKTITATTFKGNLTGNVTGNVSGSSGSCTGNAATATKLQTAQTIKLTGDVTGSASFTGNTECSISATVADDSHNHSNMIKKYTRAEVGISPNFDNPSVNGIFEMRSSSETTGETGSKPFDGFAPFLNLSADHVLLQLTGNNSSGYYIRGGQGAGFTLASTPWKRLWMQGDAVTGAVWNDYAECRESDCEEFGYVLMEVGDDSLTKTTERLSHFAGVSSDTWGFSQGETDKAKTPIAVAGRVLVYPYQDRNNYKPGDCVCAAPNGTVDIMTREEVINWPDRIVGTVSCVPEYDEWGGGKNADRDPVKVNGRIWIKIR